jgi:tetratricopeptide (TPR) repeat protein
MNNGLLVFLFLILVCFVIAIIVLVLMTFRKSKPAEQQPKQQTKNRDTILKEANKRLASNPKDVKALSIIADMYFTEGNYQKSMKAYGVLTDLCGLDPEIDEFETNLRYGLSSIQCGNDEEAYKGLVLARGKKPDMFEINSNLGILEYRKKFYDKAANMLQRALKEKPDHLDSQKHLGLSLYRMKKYQEAIPYLKQSAVSLPDDKEILFALACSHYELGQMEMALRIFTHLRPTPDWGPQSALYSGIINTKKKAYDKAILDYEIGLKHEKMSQELRLELQYRLAQVYIQEVEINNSLSLFRKIMDVNPEYKDVPELLKKYSELNANQNFQYYLLSPISDFISLCRKLATVIFPGTKIKVTDISVQKGEYIDLLAEIKTKKWEDIVLFRFTRIEGQVGELFVRDLYARTKEVHAGRAFCCAPGSFSKEARQFVEARLIDLIEKSQLMQLLQKVTTY